MPAKITSSISFDSKTKEKPVGLLNETALDVARNCTSWSVSTLAEKSNTIFAAEMSITGQTAIETRIIVANEFDGSSDETYVVPEQSGKAAPKLIP